MSPSPSFRVRWTLAAQEDLLAIVDFVAAENPAAAREIFERIRSCAADLKLMPQQGRCLPELQKFGIITYRELLPTPWRVIYRIEGQAVFVVAVLDGRRNLESLLLERLAR